jgi:hypothetical protein
LRRSMQQAGYQNGRTRFHISVAQAFALCRKPAIHHLPLSSHRKARLNGLAAPRFRATNY